MVSYQRELTPESEPFDPVDLMEGTREIVCSGSKRKYTDFYKVGVYGGIATGYTVGCNLRCFFCWVGPGRDHPERYGKLFSAEEVVKELEKVAKKSGVKKARISGGEPTLCMEHLTEVLSRLESSDMIDSFILETNGISFGRDRSYIREIEDLELPYVRVSLKAGYPETWEKKTGALSSSFELPYRAIRYLWGSKLDFHVAAMVDPRMTSKEEMKAIYERVRKVSPMIAENIEWETVDMYPNTRRRLKKMEIEL